MGWGEEKCCNAGERGRGGGVRHTAPEQSYIYCSSTVVQQKEKERKEKKKKKKREKNRPGKTFAFLSYI